MKELIKSIEPLVQEELERANKKFPQFSSPHEGYAIIKEEVEEAQSELNSVLSELWNLWNEIKDKTSLKEDLVEDTEEIIKHATNLIAESVQVAAMHRSLLICRKERTNKTKICDMDLTGYVSGRLTAVEFVEKKYGYAFWKCKCECGKEVIIRGNMLFHKQVKSCGCYRSERGRKMLIKMNIRHGDYKTRLYGIYHNMKNRCNNPNDKKYNAYGGRGIKICKEWDENYIAFKKWALANGYNDSLTINRIDGNKGYKPSNCRWATYAEQNRNISSNVWITYNNETHCLKDWSRITGIPVQTLRERKRKGLQDEKLFYKGKYKRRVN